MVEGRGARAFGGIHQDELAAFRSGDAIPEAFIGKPGGAHAGAEDQRIGVAAQRFFGALVIGGGIDAGLRGKRRSETGESTVEIRLSQAVA